jgi:uncharacterized membrane protein YciS (DUF1049 family)
VIDILLAIFLGALLIFGIVFICGCIIVMVFNFRDQITQRPRMQKRQEEFDKRFELTQQRIDDAHKRMDHHL